MTMARRTDARRAFTLVEVSVVVLIASILAVSVVPAMNTLAATRRAAAVDEVERRLIDARGQALARGRPYGVRIDADASTLQLLEITSAGATPTAAFDVLGVSNAAYSLREAYSGSAITSVVGGDGTTGSQTLWFGIDGTPQVRNASGVLQGSATQDAVVTLTGGGRVTVRAYTGAIEQ